MSRPFLSLVIPARNEEIRLPRSLGQAFAFLEKQGYTYEVIVVENASRDRTLEVARQCCGQFPGLHVLHEELPGKGRAVRRGVLAARGDFCFIADSDFSMPVEQVTRFLPPTCNPEIAIGSREAPGAVRYGEPAYRHYTGRVFNLLIRWMVLPGLQDTQCGFKCFRADIAREIFPLQTLMGWAFDVELLAIARQRGIQIEEIGIPWYYHPGSKINVLRDSWSMFLDLLVIRRNLRRGRYHAA